jgi:PAS domain-containing protein
MNLREDDSTAPASDPDDGSLALSIDLLCCLGFDGHFSRLNLAWERTLDFTPAELMSRPSIDFVHPDDREHTIQQNTEVK